MAVPDPAPSGGAPDDAGMSLHDLAVDVQSDLQRLALGLAHAGAPRPAVAQIATMAEVIGGVVKVLGTGPSGGSPAPHLGEGSPAPPQHQAPAPSQPAQPPAAAGPAATGTAPQHAMAAATHALHAAMIASAARRNAPAQ